MSEVFNGLCTIQGQFAHLEARLQEKEPRQDCAVPLVETLVPMPSNEKNSLKASSARETQWSVITPDQSIATCFPEVSYTAERVLDTQLMKESDTQHTVDCGYAVSKRARQHAKHDYM